ncbi:Myrosinase 1 [Orchesella cincta]|uniref:Myrosinase 1 n=1 Tax=Orchesella cincta TaxID=48709 RepID=A0A1D2NHS8_ORCCI|nr:Myrosinase 1 [Orchesella cincta]
MGSLKCNFDDGEFLCDTFPEGFIWGMGTASYQCEGAWDKDGKGMNIWDTFVRTMPEKIQDRSTGDVALDSYHHYKQDVQMLKSIGANTYRFSLSWARIFPNGRPDSVNQAGVDYYNNLINELLANGIQPMVTLYHWDLPQSLQDIGGWLNEEIVEIYGEYARFCFQQFGDRVQRWTTINEPFISGMMGYYYCNFAPCINDPEEGPYKYVHNQLKAHAQAYRIYEAEFKKKYNGVVGISLDTSSYFPFDKNSPEDAKAANRCFVFRLGWMLHPLYHGKYPQEMRELIDARSKNEGREVSRLPDFDDHWSKKLKGTLDFIGVNFYNAELVRGKDDGVIAPEWGLADGIPFFDSRLPGWNRDMNAYRTHDMNWVRCGAPWQDFTPTGIRECIKWISDNYGNPTMMVTETGCSGVDDKINDEQRKEFFKLSINAVLKSIKVDGCNVVGYSGWSLLDVWEWMSGYTIGFGIVHVDKSSPNMTRSLKESGKYLGTIFRNNGFPLSK